MLEQKTVRTVISLPIELKEDASKLASRKYGLSFSAFLRVLLSEFVASKRSTLLLDEIDQKKLNEVFAQAEKEYHRGKLKEFTKAEKLVEYLES